MPKSFISPTSPEIFNIKKLHRKRLVQGSVRWGRVIDRSQYKPQLLEEIPNQTKTYNKIAVGITWGTKIIWISKERIDVFGF